MAQLDDFSKIVHNGNEIGKVLHQGEVIWQSGLDLSDLNLWEQGGFKPKDGEPMETPIRIRTKDYYLIEGNSVSISIDSGYTVSVTFFRGDNSFISHSERGGSQVVTVPIGAVKFIPAIGRSDDGDIAVSEAVNANVQLQFLLSSPGLSTLIAGNMEAGFYGEVPASEFVTGDALASAIGLTPGTVINSTQPWLKFALNGKTLYVAKKHFRHTISWNNINAVGAVYGTKTVAIGGKTYKVRLLKTSLIDPMSDPFDWAEVIGSEWNKLMHPIHVKAGTQNWHRNQGVDPGVVNWGINYTDVDLETNIYNSFCQEKQGLSNVVSRGFPSIDYDASSLGTGPPSGASGWGWRPCLELVG